MTDLEHYHRCTNVYASDTSFEHITLCSNVERCNIIDLSQIKRRFQGFIEILQTPMTLNLHQLPLTVYSTLNITRKTQLKKLFFSA